MDSIIVPLVKDCKGDMTSKDNYRPIALTCISSKIFELLILIRYKDLFETSPNQFSFKRKHGTDMSVFILRETINFYLYNSSPIYMCFLDASKAFDRINYWHMCSKLLQRNVPKIIVRIFMYWFTSQQFVVKWCHTYSQPFCSSNGLRQGGILSPIYFNVFMDGLSALLNQTKIGCHRSNTCCNHIFYADDSVLLAPSPYALQYLISVCEKYALDNELVFNKKKTVCMSILPKKLSKCINVPNMILEGQILKWVSEQKYLGVFISNNNCDDRDIMREVRSIYSRGNMIISKFRKCTEDVKIRLFKSFCTSLYCSSLWCNFKKVSLMKLKVAYNNIFRALMGIDRRCSISQCYVKYGVDSFNELYRKYVHSFQERLHNSENALVKINIFNSYFIYKSPMNLNWFNVLYII